MDKPTETTDKCLRCGQPLWTFGVQDLRMGGSGSGSHLVFGRLAELGEEMVGLEFLACRKCGKVELRIPG
jgi:hypothetical protein